MKMFTVPLSCIALCCALAAVAQQRQEIPLPPSQNPGNAEVPIAGAVWAGDTLYVSGWLDPDRRAHPDTRTQTVAILQDLQKLLVSQGLTLGDVAMLRMYLGADPARDNKADVAGMSAGYAQFFGTREQPHKPARTTVQVVLPAAASGGLVEVDLVAVRTK